MSRNAKQTLDDHCLNKSKDLDINQHTLSCHVASRAPRTVVWQSSDPKMNLRKYSLDLCWFQDITNMMSSIPSFTIGKTN